MLICDRCGTREDVKQYDYDYYLTKPNPLRHFCKECYHEVAEMRESALSSSKGTGGPWSYSIPPRPVLWWKHLAIAVLGGAIGAIGILVLYLNHVRHH